LKDTLIFTLGGFYIDRNGVKTTQRDPSLASTKPSPPATTDQGAEFEARGGHLGSSSPRATVRSTREFSTTALR